MNSSWCSTQHGENSQSLTMWVITIARAEKVWAKIQNKFESPLRNIDAGEQRKYSSYPFRVSIFLSGFWVLPVNATLSGESESSKYGSQVSTRPSNHASIASLNGLDRDSEVTLLSPASPQEICPLGVQLWTNPLGITDQLILRKDRCKVPLNTDLLFMYRTSVWYRLSTLRLTTSLLDVRYRTNPKGI